MTIKKKRAIIETVNTDKQVSPSGMAAASQAVPGEFDSRHLLQKQKHPQRVLLFLEIDRLLKRVDGGAVLQGQNALPHIVGITVNLTAKSAIENCRAGRAAKGATLGLTQSCSLRSGTLTPTYRRSLISSLKSVINAFLNGQLVLLQPSTLPLP